MLKDFPQDLQLFFSMTDIFKVEKKTRISTNFDKIAGRKAKQKSLKFCSGKINSCSNFSKYNLVEYF